MDNKQENTTIAKGKYVPTTQFYGQIIASLHNDSIFTSHKELIINRLSSGSKKIVGYENDEVIGQHLDIIFTEENIKNGIPIKKSKQP